jgi:hypothetical protein
MSSTGAFGDRLGRYFGLDGAPSLTTPTPQNPQFAVTRLACTLDQLARKQTIPPEDAFILTLHLNRLHHLELWQRGRPISACTCRPGSISIVNLVDELAVYIGGPLDCLSFYIPRLLLDRLTDQAGEPRLKQLRCPPGLPDPIIEQIGAALLPLIDVPDKVAPAFLEHIALATGIHVAHAYGNFQPRPGFTPRGTAAP